MFVVSDNYLKIFIPEDFMGWHGIQWFQGFFQVATLGTVYATRVCLLLYLIIHGHECHRNMTGKRPSDIICLGSLRAASDPFFMSPPRGVIWSWSSHTRVWLEWTWMIESTPFMRGGDMKNGLTWSSTPKTTISWKPNIFLWQMNRLTVYSYLTRYSDRHARFGRLFTEHLPENLKTQKA